MYLTVSVGFLLNKLLPQIDHIWTSLPCSVNAASENKANWKLLEYYLNRREELTTCALREPEDAVTDRVSLRWV